MNNSFVRHHRELIGFAYRCFDRIVFNLLIQHLQVRQSVIGFLMQRRQAKCITAAFLKRVANGYRNWLENQAQQRGIPIVEPPKKIERDQWVTPFFKRLNGHNGVAVILKCREPARLAVSFPSLYNYVDVIWRNVTVYYLYLQHAELGRMFLRICPFFPFNCQVCLNGHEWLAQQLRRENIAFTKKDNAFLGCANPERLQELADRFSAELITSAIDGLLDEWLPYITPTERRQGFRHRLFANQIEYCDNLIFHKHANVRGLLDRIMDLNRSIGQPQKLAIIFGRKQFRPSTRGAKMTAKILDRRVPIIRSGFQSTSVKQYVKEGLLLRTESTCHQLKDLALRKDIRHLQHHRQVLSQSNERYQNALQDVLVTYIDRGQLAQLRQPTVSPSGRRTPGLRLDDPRLLAVWQAVLAIINLVGHGTFRTKDLLDSVRYHLGQPDYKLSQLRYDLSKLRGKGLVERIDGTQNYRLSQQAYRIGVLYCKLYHRVYAPMTSGLLSPYPQDYWIPGHRRSKLDRLYAALDHSLHRLSDYVGLRDTA